MRRNPNHANRCDPLRRETVTPTLGLALETRAPDPAGPACALSFLAVVIQTDGLYPSAQGEAMSTRHTWIRFMLSLPIMALLSFQAQPSLASTPPGIQRDVCDSAVLTGGVRYVSLSGNDATADGSLERPYRTLSSAVQSVQANETIAVRAGTYQEPNEIRIREPGVTLRSYPGEWAVIDRGDAASSEDSGIYFYVGADAGVLTCMEVIGGYYVVSTETKWDWGDPNDRAGTSRIRIDNNRLHGSYADVIKIKPNSDDILIRHNEIFDSGIGQPDDDCNAEGIDNVNGDRTQVADNHIHDICSTGVYLKGGATDGVVERNLIERAGGAGILLGFDTSPEYFDLTANPDDYENIRGIARDNLIRDVGWAGIGFYASRDAQAYNNTIIDAARQYHSPLYFGLSYQDWDAEAGRPPNLNPTIFGNVVSQSRAVATDPALVSIRNSDDLGGMSALTGNPTMFNNCYFRQAGAASFADSRTDWSGNLAEWQTHIDGDAGSYDVDPQLDADFRPRNALCVGRGHLGAVVVDRGRLDWQVTEIYLATLGDAPDNEGLQYWVDQMETNPAWTPTTVAQSFFDQPLVRQQYPADQDVGTFINALYQNLFGRAADAAGAAYWRDELTSGRVARNQMIIALIEGGWSNAAAATDMARFGNRVTVGLAFAAEQATRGIRYSALDTTAQAALRQMGRDLIAGVSADTATRDQAIARIPGLLDGL
jgi:hypothetical protein